MNLRIEPSELRQADEIYKFGPFVLNVTRRELRVPLPRRAMDLLIHLVRNPGRLFEAEDLMMKLWRQTNSSRNSLWHTVGDLRNALRDPAKPYDLVDTNREGKVQFIGKVEQMFRVESDEGEDDDNRIVMAPRG